jgi:hypothetical protein
MKKKTIIILTAIIIIILLIIAFMPYAPPSQHKEDKNISIICPKGCYYVGCVGSCPVCDDCIEGTGTCVCPSNLECHNYSCDNCPKECVIRCIGSCDIDEYGIILDGPTICDFP